MNNEQELDEWNWPRAIGHIFYALFTVIGILGIIWLIGSCSVGKLLVP